MEKPQSQSPSSREHIRCCNSNYLCGSSNIVSHIAGAAVRLPPLVDFFILFRCPFSLLFFRSFLFNFFPTLFWLFLCFFGTRQQVAVPTNRAEASSLMLLMLFVRCFPLPLPRPSYALFVIMMKTSSRRNDGGGVQIKQKNK